MPRGAAALRRCELNAVRRQSPGGPFGVRSPPGLFHGKRLSESGGKAGSAGSRAVTHPISGMTAPPLRADTLWKVQVGYELLLDDGTEKLVASDELIDVGDALILGGEVLLVLRESDQAATRGRTRFVCRRAFQLQGEMHDLIAYVEELGLQFTRVRDTYAA